MGSTVIVVIAVMTVCCVGGAWTDTDGAHILFGSGRLDLDVVTTGKVPLWRGDAGGARAGHVRAYGVASEGLHERGGYAVHIDCRESAHGALDSTHWAGVERVLGRRVPRVFLPPDSVLVHATEAEAMRLGELAYVDWIGEYHAGLKYVWSQIQSHVASGCLVETPVATCALDVVIHEGADLDLVAADLGRLSGLSGEGVSVAVVGTRRVRVVWAGVRRWQEQGGSEDLLREAVDQLASHRGVTWVGVRSVVVAPRNRFARSVVQGGLDVRSPAPSSVVDPAEAAAAQEPAFAAGLRGEGQIVSCGDTGVDYDLCFFFDPDHPVPLNANVSEHRKFVSYVVFKDGSDRAGGHGTHVVGSFVGDALDNDSLAAEYNGMAPKARLVFADLGDSRGQLFPPQDLAEFYFPEMYVRGSRIHSDSWGADATYYDAFCHEVDTFQWSHQDFLYVIAAGNTGSDGAYSVATPGNAKNGLSVGASFSSLDSWKHHCGITPDPLSGQCSRSTLKEFNGGGELAFSPANVACFSSEGPTAGDYRLKPDLMGPGYYIYSARSDGVIGSTQDGRCQGTDFAFAEAGTSMAAPIVAGTATLVRQYFTEGRWPSAHADPAAGFAPSAALLKAVLLAGARDMGAAGGTYHGQCSTAHLLSVPAGPNYVSGFGLIQVNASVPLSPGSPVRVVLQPSPDPALETGEMHALCFQVPAGASVPSVRILTAWQDPPPAHSAGIVLVNNLDMQVTHVPSGSLWRGNVQLPRDAQDKSTPRDTGDKNNNVEFVDLTDPRPGAYVVTVRGTQVPLGPQPFAAVVNGHHIVGGSGTGTCDPIWRGDDIPSHATGGSGTGTASDASPSSGRELSLAANLVIGLASLVVLLTAVFCVHRQRLRTAAPPQRYTILGSGSSLSSSSSSLASSPPVQAQSTAPASQASSSAHSDA